MSYILQKPYSETQRADFVVKYNHNHGLTLADTETALYALEPDEIMQDGVPVKNPNYDSLKLTKAKEEKTAEINTAKELAFKEGVLFNGSHFDCDDRAQDRTGNRLLLLQAMPVESLIWLDYNYKEVNLSAQEFQELCASIFERVQFIEFRTGTLFESVEAAQSIEELDAILINFD